MDRRENEQNMFHSTSNDLVAKIKDAKVKAIIATVGGVGGNIVVGGEAYVTKGDSAAAIAIPFAAAWGVLAIKYFREMRSLKRNI
ncbi:MAG: hypothetical protein HYT11_00685 [Candidatus Levybacteria bacterium]|nr:hypothetical protein [Candidatus Levybacteria bacterium]